MDLAKKIEYAKSLGISQAPNMKEATLDKRIAEAEQGEPKRINLNLGTAGKDVLRFFEFPIERLQEIAVDGGFDEIKYNKLRQCFECYVKGEAVGMIELKTLIEGGK